MRTRKLRWVAALVLASLLVTLLGASVVAAGDRGAKPIVKFGGLIQARPADTVLGMWEVEGHQVEVTAETTIVEDKGPADVGARVVVIARKVEGEALRAMVIRVEEPSAETEFVTVKGFIQTLEADHLVVNDLTFQLTEQTRVEGTLEVGAFVKVVAMVTPTGYVATKVEVEDDEDDREVEFEGAIQSFSDTLWVVAGRQVTVTPDTEIEGTPVVGAVAEVKALLLAGGTLQAVKIEVEEPELEEVEFKAVIQSFPADLYGDWVVGEYTVWVTTTAEIKGVPEVGLVAEVEALKLADGTLQAKKIEIEDEDDEEDEEDEPEEIEFTGTIESFPAGLKGDWVIGGRTVQVTAASKVEGTPEVGLVAEVEALQFPDGTLRAKEIEIESPEEDD